MDAGNRDTRCTRRAALAMCAVVSATLPKWFAPGRAFRRELATELSPLRGATPAEEPCFLDSIDADAPLPMIVCVRTHSNVATLYQGKAGPRY